MSAPEDNPADDEPMDREAYEDWHAKEHGKEQRAAEEAKDYLLIAVANKSPCFRGHDSYLTPWDGSQSLVGDYLDALEVGEPATVTFTVLRMTDEEYAAYCEMNGVEVE